MVKRFGIALCVALLSWCVDVGAAERPPRCTYQISPTNASLGAAGGSGAIAVTTSGSCAWTATSSAAFLTITSGASGTGNGTVTYAVAANTATMSRKGTISVAGKRFVLEQAGAPLPPANQAPVANAGAPRTIAGGSPVILNGSGSDPEGQPITYRWRQTAGAAVTLSSATIPNPSFTAPAATSVSQALTFELVVSDGALNSAPSSVVITVAAVAANQAPTANAGTARTVTGETLVTLSGSGSDPEGQPITYTWRQTAGAAVALSSATIASPSFTAPAASSVSQALTFDLVVSDGALNSAPSSVTITVAALPEPPPPSLDPAYATGDVGSVGLAGSATSSSGVFTVSGAGADIWGTADSFRFVYQQLSGDGEVVARVASMQNTNQYAKAGIMLRDSLAAGGAHVMLAMKPNGELELMSRAAANGITSWLAGVTPGVPVYIKLARVGGSVTGYYSKDGASWSKLGTGTATLPSAVYAGLIVCSHDTARLNTSTFDNVAVTRVPSVPNLPPTANAGLAQTVTGGSTVTLSGSGSDPEGQPLTYRWTQRSGTGVVLSNSTAPAPTFVAPPATTLALALGFQLVVNDGVQDSVASTVTVTVSADPNAPPPTSGSLLPARPAGGSTLSVPAGGNLQAAINAAQPGDVIVLAGGATYTGNFSLPAKGGSAYVMIRSSVSFNEGTRVTPATTGLARIVSPTQAPALVTQAGASYYWLEGLEFTTAGGTNDIVRLGDGSSSQNTLGVVPHDFVMSHCYVHGRAGIEQKRGIALNSGLTYIADSHVDEIKGAGYDAQAIAGWNGPGPYRIYNNYLSGAGEVFLLGGSDPAIQNLVPTDIVFKGNLLTRPTSWRNSTWTVKNIFELKNAQQVLVDGNVFEYNWQAAQAGPAIVLTPRNQDGRAPWTVVRDVQFVNNRVRHVAAVFNILGYDNLNPSQLTQNIVIANNVFEDVSSTNWGGAGRLLLINGGDNIRVEHNTVFQDGTSFVYAYGSQTTNFSFTSNIVPHGAYGVMGDGTSPVSGTLTAYFPGWVFTGNLVVASRTSYPAGNTCPATMSDVGFVSLASGDYTLAPTSPYVASGADGTAPGADMTKIPR